MRVNKHLTMEQIFPLMLTGVVAFNVLRVLPVSDPRIIGVLLVGYVFQGRFLYSICFTDANDVLVQASGFS
jgi:hypothetical protein